MLVAVLLPVLVGLTGLGIDAANLYLAHSQLQAAVDAAALAGSLQLPYDPDLDQGLVEAAVEDFLTRNMDTARVAEMAPGTETRSVRVLAEAEPRLMILPALGITPPTLSATATAGFNNLEVVLVIDNSGSMKGTPINATNTAAKALVNLLLPDGAAPAIKVGLVPFRGSVRVPAGVDGLPAGCRNADGSENTGLLDEYMEPEYRNPYWYTPSIPDTCGSIPYVHGLTGDKAVITAAISTQDALGSGSGTIISEGLRWGRHVLSPASPFTEGSDDDDMRKIIILLTDGDTEDGSCGGSYATWYTPNSYWTNAYYGMGDTESHCEDNGALNQAMLDQAAAAKAEGVEIFTIRFGSSDYVDISLMKALASSKAGTDDHYFDAPSAYDIDDVFKLIGRQLGWRLLN